jgi:DNA invertase Pin-like site-specific DNA recombinase
MHKIGQRVGYIRVSTIEQTPDRQLSEIGDLDKTFTDRTSGKNLQRPQLTELLSYVRSGDTVVVHSMDRLARSLDDLRSLVLSLTAREINVEFIKEGLTFTGEDSPVANLLLSVMGAVAEFERSLLLERQREGIALAKKRGAYRGRKKILSDEQQSQLRARVASGEPKAKIARDLKISRETLYNYIR